MSDEKVKSANKMFWSSVAATALSTGYLMYNTEQFKKTTPKPMPVVGEMINLENKIYTTKNEIAYDIDNPNKMFDELLNNYLNQQPRTLKNSTIQRPTLETVNLLIQQKRDLQKDLESKLNNYKNNPTFVSAYNNYQAERKPYDKKFSNKINNVLYATFGGCILLTAAGFLHGKRVVEDLHEKGYTITAMVRGVAIVQKTNK